MVTPDDDDKQHLDIDINIECPVNAMACELNNEYSVMTLDNGRGRQTKEVLVRLSIDDSTDKRTSTKLKLRYRHSRGKQSPECVQGATIGSANAQQTRV